MLVMKSVLIENVKSVHSLKVSRIEVRSKRKHIKIRRPSKLDKVNKVDKVNG